MVSASGRPYKYPEIFCILEENKVYIPSSIVRLIENTQLLQYFAQKNTKRSVRILKRAIRITFGRFSHNKKLTRTMTRLVKIKGQAPTPGILGLDWIDALSQDVTPTRFRKYIKKKKQRPYFVINDLVQVEVTDEAKTFLRRLNENWPRSKTISDLLMALRSFLPKKNTISRNARLDWLQQFLERDFGRYLEAKPESRRDQLEKDQLEKKTFNNTTITLSIPHEVKTFLDRLADDGYNRSSLILKMINIVHVLYYTYPQIPLPRGIERLHELVRNGLLLREFTDGHPNPKLDE